MSKINQIQNALRSLGDAAFQKLAEAYLHKKGYGIINSIGSVVGSDKVKTGTPDTLIPLSNGRYIFAEYTTQKGGVCTKFKADLSKCLDEVKTGIPISKIEEIILCHTSLFTTDEEESIREECQKYNINSNIFGISAISYDLYQKYPGIARDFLDIEVDTGQIVTPDEFVALYSKNAIATPLNTNFHFRKSELEEVLQKLDDNNLVIISGKTGIGKSRFALEACNLFAESHPGYQVRCIFLRGADLFEDLRVHFSEPGQYLIFVDDANRVNQFNCIVDLLHDRREDRQIKIIVTVRDYALERVKEKSLVHGRFFELQLKSLDDETIRHIVGNEYSINDRLYLDRIVNISQGNPRLAIMAAEVVKRANTFESIVNVSSLYDEYYSSIRKDMEELNDENILKTAGILAFFRVVDYSKEEMIEAIEVKFKMPKEIFWESICRLHQLELLEIHEDEVVKISDQVLATYLFYLTFFAKRVVNFSVLLNNFFPDLQHRLVDALNPVLNTFDSQKVIDVLRPSVDLAWETYKSANNEIDLMHLIEVFWFLKETDTLIYINDLITEIEAEEIYLSTLDLKPDSNLSSPSILTTLGVFIYSSDANFKMALELLFKYLTKCPDEVQRVLYLLTVQFGFKHDSYALGFIKQQTVIEVLWKEVKEGKNVLLSKLFLAVAEQYLYTNFSTTSFKTRNTLNTLSFDLPSTAELLQLRKTIWRHVFHLYRVLNFKDDVLNLLYKYSTCGYQVNVNELIKQDSAEIILFIETDLETGSYRSCLIVEEYLNFLENRGIPFKQNLQDRFKNQAYNISKVLLLNGTEKENYQRNHNHSEYEEFKRQRFTQYFNSYTFSDYQQFFNQCVDIQNEGKFQDRSSYFLSEIVDVLSVLANRDPDLYIKVLEYYLSLGDSFKFHDSPLVYQLIQICDVERTYELLNKFEYSSKNKRLFYFYQLLSQEKITIDHLEQLYHLYEGSKQNYIPDSLDFLLKYQLVDKSVIIRVAKIIWERSHSESNIIGKLSQLFNKFTEVNIIVYDLFKNNLPLLKQVYISVTDVDRHVDYNLQSFASILDLDPDFIIEHVNWIFKNKNQSYCLDSSHNYSFLWRREDYNNLINRTLEHIYKTENNYFLSNSFALKLFILKAEDRDGECLCNKQDTLLKNIIKHRHHDIRFIQLIFSIITQFSYPRRYQLIAMFVENNSNFKDFQKIPLESFINSWSGSAVPMYQARIDYYQSLIPCLNKVELLQHRQYIEKRIQGYRETVESEKKKDFMEE